MDAAVSKAYNNSKKIHWMEIYAGEKSTRVYGGDVAAGRNHGCPERLRGVDQGPDDHPVGGGIRSLNVAPAPGAGSVRLPAPGALVHRRALAAEAPDLTDMVIFRENTEDIYAGIGFEAETDGATRSS